MQLQFLDVASPSSRGDTSDLMSLNRFITLQQLEQMGFLPGESLYADRAEQGCVLVQPVSYKGAHLVLDGRGADESAALTDMIRNAGRVRDIDARYVAVMTRRA